jgi:NTE family protein
MGSIVGGAYASGLTPAEIEDVLKKANWDEIFTDRPPRAEISSRRKEDDTKALFAPEFGLKDGNLALPKGIVAGVSIEIFLRALTKNVASIGDFGKLPIPFRAVASDIETGEEVVIARGSVPQAMRASMSIPGFVAPVEIDGRLLVDGGIANNLPIDVVRKTCGDVVIAVNIGTPPLRREEIGSAFTVVAQLINFLGKSTVDRQVASLGPRDVLIEPQLGDISSGCFDRAVDAIAIGESAARAASASLRRYSVSPGEYAALRATQVAAVAQHDPVDEIRIEGLERTNAEVLRSLLQTRPGEPYSEETIAADLRRIYGRGDFESVDYRITRESDRRILTIMPREKSWGPNYLRFGLGLASDFSGENSFNALVSYRRTWVNRLGGEWLLEGQVGRNAYAYTEFYQPLSERGHWFVAPYARVGRDTRDLFLADDRVATYMVRDDRAGLDLGTVFGTWGESRLGFALRKVRAQVETGSALLPDLDVNASAFGLKLRVDQFDHPYFPREGAGGLLTLGVTSKALGADKAYQRLYVAASGAHSWGAHTLNGMVAGGTDFNSGLPAYDTFSLGGPLRLSGYKIDQFAGRHMAFGRLMYYNRALKLPDLFGSGLYAGASAEVGRTTGSFIPGANENTLWSSSVFLAADTFLGPAYFGFGFGAQHHYALYLMIGAP